jgi:hypothetical protein
LAEPLFLLPREGAVHRWHLAFFLALVATCSFTVVGSARGGEQTKEKNGHDQHAAHFEACARACTTCLRACESCALHCAKLVNQGKKDHLRTLGTCLDCAEFCASAARIVSRHGPLSNTICEACAKACENCGGQCKKFSDDEHMQQCAKACRECAQACREMIQHAQGAKAAPVEQRKLDRANDR